MFKRFLVFITLFGLVSVQAAATMKQAWANDPHFNRIARRSVNTAKEGKSEAASPNIKIVCCDLHDLLFQRNSIAGNAWEIFKSADNKFKMFFTALNPIFWKRVQELRKGHDQSAEEMVGQLAEQYPCLQSHMDEFMTLLTDYVPVQESIDVIRNLKEAGVSLVMASNVGPKCYEIERVKPSLESTFALFDHVFTAFVDNHSNKPHEEYYIALRKKVNEAFGVDNSVEILFFDDRPINVQGARTASSKHNLKIRAIHFETPEQFRKDLENAGYFEKIEKTEVITDNIEGSVLEIQGAEIAEDNSENESFVADEAGAEVVESEGADHTASDEMNLEDDSAQESGASFNMLVQSYNVVEASAVEKKAEQPTMEIAPIEAPLLETKPVEVKKPERAPCPVRTTEPVAEAVQPAEEKKEEAPQTKTVPTQKPQLLDFYGDRCPPCKRNMPIVEQLQQEYADRYDIEKINTDQNPGLSSQYGVRSLPTFVFIDKYGNVVHKEIGFTSKEKLEALMSQYLG